MNATLDTSPMDKGGFTTPEYGKTEAVVDFLNQPINVGDTVVYPNRQGSSMWMNKAVVTNVNSDGSLQVCRSGGSPRRIHCVDRVVVVTKG